MNEGEFVAIMGESGSGKTTLLNILAGLDTPTSGQVLLTGRDMTTVRESQMAAFRRKVDANPARFERLAKAVMKEKDFRVSGEEYARPKGHRGDVIDRWYNRKRLGIEVSRDFGGDVLSERLPEILVDCYEKLMPMFDFLMEVYREEPGSSR